MARQRNKRNVVWSPLSEKDIDDILDYFAEEGSLEAGERIVAQIYQNGEMLEKQPLLWRLREDIFYGARLVIVHPYVIVYRISDSIPEIIRILHEHRDFGPVFDIDEIL